MVPGRSRGPQLQRLQQEATLRGFPTCAVVRGKGRRSGASETLVSDLLTAGATVVILPSLAALHPVPARALGVLGALLSAGVRVVSTSDGWVASLDPQTVAAVATYLLNDETRRNSRRGRSVIAAVRRTGRKVGRPAIPIDVDEARRLVELGGYRRAGRALRVSASSVRRALLKAGTH